MARSLPVPSRSPTTAAKIGRTWNEVRANRLAYVFLAPTVIAMLALVLYPLVQGIWLSFTDADQYNTARHVGKNFVAAKYQFIGLQNYVDLFLQRTGNFWRVFGQTAIWTVVNVFFQFAIGLILALLLNRPIRGRAIYRTLLLLPWAVPSYITAFSWRWMYNQDYGLINAVLTGLGIKAVPWLSDPFWAMTAVIIANIWLGFPFVAVTLLGGLQSIPVELYEAARVDGANRIQQFRHITMPLLRPVAVTVSLLGIIWTFNAFNLIFLVTEGGPFERTEILATYAWRWGFQRWEFGIAASYSVVILLILMVFSISYMRLLTQKQEVYA